MTWEVGIEITYLTWEVGIDHLFDMGGRYRDHLFDMGGRNRDHLFDNPSSEVSLVTGTSTDVSRYAGEYEHVFESTTAGVAIQAAQLDINTVAAGGGSRLFFRSGMFAVGPESAGANPGPTCYGKGQ